MLDNAREGSYVVRTTLLGTGMDTDGVMMRQSTLDLDELRQRRSLIITRQEAAEALGVDPRTITVGIDDGAIPSVKLGRRVVIPREKFLRLFEADVT